MDLLQLKHYEVAVLSACFRNDNAINIARRLLSDDCFADDVYRGVWKAMCQLNDKGAVINVLSVLQVAIENRVAIEKLSLELIADDSSYESNEDVTYNAEVLFKERNERDFCTLTSSFQEKIEKGECSLDDAQREFDSFFEKKTLIQGGIVSLRSSIISLRDRILGNLNNQKPEGTPTGFDELDNTNGFHKGEFIVIAGATSHGKTSFALSITLHAITHGFPIAYYSLEMNHISLTARLTAMLSRIPASDMLYKKLSKEEEAIVEESMHKLPKSKLFYDDNNTSTFEGIVSSIRLMKKQKKIEGVVIDYLQILNVNTNSKETKEQVMAGIARKFKNLAVELDIWIVALSQLSRDRENPQPRLDRLRDSGQIAEAADVVIFVYRPELYGRNYDFEYKDMPTQNTAMIEVAKGRNIGICKFIADFEPTLTHFTRHQWTEEEKKKFEENCAARKNNVSRGAKIAEGIKGNGSSNSGQQTIVTPPVQVAQPYTPPPEEPDIPFAQENPNEKLPF